MVASHIHRLKSDRVKEISVEVSDKLNKLCRLCAAVVMLIEQCERLMSLSAKEACCLKSPLTIWRCIQLLHNAGNPGQWLGKTYDTTYVSSHE